MKYDEITVSARQTLRAYLTKVVTAIMVLVISMAAYQAYQTNLSYSAQRYDTELTTLANLLLSVEITAVADLDKLDNSILYEVRQDEAHVVSAFPISEKTSEFPLGFSEQNIGFTRWRIYHTTNQKGKRVIVGFNTITRFAYADELISRSIMPFIIGVPLCIVALLIAVRFATRPLRELEEQLLLIDFKALKPIQLEHSFRELLPVVNTTNELLTKLHESYAREQTFSGNVAHELRTPLSVLKINVQNAIQQFPEAKSELAPMGKHIDRLINVTNQLLLLAKTHPQWYQGTLSLYKIVPTVQGIISDMYPKFLAKKQDIEFHFDSLQANTLHTNLYLFELLLVNLLNNAHKYTQLEAKIEVRILFKARYVELIVADSGTFLNDQDIAKLTERFFRSQQVQDTDGAGLGLALIQQIVAIHRGELRLQRSNLGGLEVSVRFPKDIQNTGLEMT
jgi:two-component system sensor histidine kinase QseC